MSELLKSEADVRVLFEQVGLSSEKLQRKFPEWLELEKLARENVHLGQIEVLGFSNHEERAFPLLGFSFGSREPAAPVLGIFGGVHGLERIGAQVSLSLLRSFSDLLLWDELLRHALKSVRLIFFPIVNPWGLYRMTRANPRGVDLMRNSPVSALEKPTWLVGGHRLSKHLPWYRGTEGLIEEEARALIDFARDHSFDSERVIHLDFHSGFGTTDRIWFPYAKTTTPFPHLAELHALKEAFERTHPHHFYQIEPQAKNYTTHGDLWDFLYDEYLRKQASSATTVYLPLAVEMGSWMWVKKNPLQLFSPLGPFNPVVPHRHKRVLRRHHTLFDFLLRALVSSEVWLPSFEEQRAKHRLRAEDLWYRHKGAP